VRGIGLALEEERAGGDRLGERAGVVGGVVGQFDVAAGLRMGGLGGEKAVRIAIQGGEIGVDGFVVLVDLFMRRADQVIGLGGEIAFGRAGDDFFEQRDGALGRGESRQEQDLAFFALHQGLGEAHLARQHVVELEPARIVVHEMLVGIESGLELAAVVQAAGIVGLGPGRFFRVRPPDAQGQRLLGRRAHPARGVEFLHVRPLGVRRLFVRPDEQVEAPSRRLFRIRFRDGSGGDRNERGGAQAQGPSDAAPKADGRGFRHGRNITQRMGAGQGPRRARRRACLRADK